MELRCVIDTKYDKVVPIVKDDYTSDSRFAGILDCLKDRTTVVEFQYNSKTHLAHGCVHSLDLDEEFEFDMGEDEYRVCHYELLENIVKYIIVALDNGITSWHHSEDYHKEHFSFVVSSHCDDKIYQGFVVEENYERAEKALKFRFGNDVQIISLRIKKIIITSST